MSADQSVYQGNGANKLQWGERRGVSVRAREGEREREGGREGGRERERERESERTVSVTESVCVSVCERELTNQRITLG